VTPTVIGKAEAVARRVGCPPLAIGHAAPSMMKFHQSLDDMLNSYQGNHKIHLCLDLESSCYLRNLIVAHQKILRWMGGQSTYLRRKIYCSNFHLSARGFANCQRSPRNPVLLRARVHTTQYDHTPCRSRRQPPGRTQHKTKNTLAKRFFGLRPDHSYPRR
jgi:hypothetical protein